MGLRSKRYFSWAATVRPHLAGRTKWGCVVLCCQKYVAFTGPPGFSIITSAASFPFAARASANSALSVVPIFCLRCFDRLSFEFELVYRHNQNQIDQITYFVQALHICELLQLGE